MKIKGSKKLRIFISIGGYISTCCLHWLYGQYSWSMSIGLPTLFMMISSKCILEAMPAGEAGHVFTLMPFWVLVRVLPVTLMPTTGASFAYFPRLPTLMPWPGPQVTWSMVICSLPSPMEMQSSPVFMFVLVMLIPDERPMWIPSVFRLSSGALTVKW